MNLRYFIQYSIEKHEIINGGEPRLIVRLFLKILGQGEWNRIIYISCSCQIKSIVEESRTVHRGNGDKLLWSEVINKHLPIDLVVIDSVESDLLDVEEHPIGVAKVRNHRPLIPRTQPELRPSPSKIDDRRARSEGQRYPPCAFFVVVVDLSHISIKIKSFLRYQCPMSRVVSRYRYQRISNLICPRFHNVLDKFTILRAIRWRINSSLQITIQVVWSGRSIRPKMLVKRIMINFVRSITKTHLRINHIHFA